MKQTSSWRVGIAALSCSVLLIVETSCNAFTSTPCDPNITGPFLDHSKNQPYDALVLVVDRSTSPEPDQFDDLLRFLQKRVDNLNKNDKVWIMDIQGPGYRPIVKYDFPSGSDDRCAGEAAEEHLNKIKIDIRKTIADMTQVSNATCIVDPVRRALGILSEQRGARSRILVIGSDFLTDDGGHCSPNPGEARSVSGAAGIQVLLLYMIPKEADRRKCGETDSSHALESVRANWSTFFTSQGAASVNVERIDSIAAPSDAPRTKETAGIKSSAEACARIHWELGMLLLWERVP